MGTTQSKEIEISKKMYRIFYNFIENETILQQFFNEWCILDNHGYIPVSVLCKLFAHYLKQTEVYNNWYKNKFSAECSRWYSNQLVYLHYNDYLASVALDLSYLLIYKWLLYNCPYTISAGKYNNTSIYEKPLYSFFSKYWDDDRLIIGVSIK